MTVLWRWPGAKIMKLIYEYLHSKYKLYLVIVTTYSNDDTSGSFVYYYCFMICGTNEWVLKPSGLCSLSCVIPVNLSLTQRGAAIKAKKFRVNSHCIRHWKDQLQDCQMDCPDAITEEPGSRDGPSEKDGSFAESAWMSKSHQTLCVGQAASCTMIGFYF